MGSVVSRPCRPAIELARWIFKCTHSNEPAFRIVTIRKVPLKARYTSRYPIPVPPVFDASRHRDAPHIQETPHG